VQFGSKLRGKHTVQLRREISQRISQGEFLLFGGEQITPSWRMVDGSVVWLWFGKAIGYAFTYL
jgi:hypothetical protein